MDRPLRILFTNNTLMKPAGTERAVSEVARVLISRGHEVAAFSPLHGQTARGLLDLGAQVTGDLASTPPPWRPDVIHGQHEWETSLAALRWPDVPLLSFCRGILNWQEEPCAAPWVFRYVAIDEPCRERIVDSGISPEKIALVLNGIDMTRFPRRGPLPERPERALVFSNYASESRSNYLPVVREACRAQGIECDAVGAGVGNVVTDPGAVLGDYDIVFAKGKAALEASASGCAVVVCDAHGLGAMLTPDNWLALRRQSFGFPCMTDPVDAEGVKSRLGAYDAGSQHSITGAVRETCSLERNVDELEALYRQAITTAPNPTADEIARFATDFLAPKSIPYKIGQEVMRYFREHRNTAPPQSSPEQSLEHDRILDSYRKGLAAARGLKQVDADKKAAASRASRSPRSRIRRAWDVLRGKE